MEAAVENFSPNLQDAETADSKEAFSYFDKDGDGFIAVKDLPVLMTFLGHCQSEEQLQECLADCNSPGDGVIHFSQFMRILQWQMKHNGEHEMELREALLNFANKGFSQGHAISVEEFRFAMTNLGDKLSFDEVDALLCDLAVDEVGYTTADEIIDVIKKHI